MLYQIYWYSIFIIYFPPKFNKQEMLPQTIKVMKSLRELNKSLKNGMKISKFVDSYLDECILNNKALTIITPWSLAKGFEKRYHNQFNKFCPIDKEIKLFRKEIPQIINLFEENGLKFNWWIIFPRSYI